MTYWSVFLDLTMYVLVLGCLFALVLSCGYLFDRYSSMDFNRWHDMYWPERAIWIVILISFVLVGMFSMAGIFYRVGGGEF